MEDFLSSFIEIRFPISNLQTRILYTYRNMSRLKVGLVPMAAKPYHAGHDGLVRIAANENDSVILFVSTSDRSRPGEIKISGNTMHKIWKESIEPTLPGNVFPNYGGVPVTSVYKALENAEAEGSTDTFVIYSDDEDILKYTDEKLKKSAPALFANGQIERRGISRTETVQVSGTKMREFLRDGNVERFVSSLPPAIQDRGKEVFDLLKGEFIGKYLLRRYIKTLIMENFT